MFEVKYAYVDERANPASNDRGAPTGIAQTVAKLMNVAHLPAIVTPNPKPTHAGDSDRAPGTPQHRTSTVARRAPGEEAFVIGDTRLNIVIVRDRADRMATYERLISALDAPVDQVEMSVSVLDIDASNAHELRFALESDAIEIDANEGQLGLSTSLWDAKGITLRIRALRSAGKSRILTQPSVTTLDNHEASFQNNRSFYVRLGKSENESAELASVSYGWMVRIRPHVIRDGTDTRVQLSVHIEDGTRGGAETAVTGVPEVAQNVIRTQAIVPEGSSLLIGGYTVREQTRVRAKDPLARNGPGDRTTVQLQRRARPSGRALLPHHAQDPPERGELHVQRRIRRGRSRRCARGKARSAQGADQPAAAHGRRRRGEDPRNKRTRALGRKATTMAGVPLDQASVHSAHATASAIAHSAARATGSLRGERIEQIADPSKRLEEAAEELGFAEGERAEKRLAKRKLASGASAAERRRAQLLAVPDLEHKERLENFLTAVLTAKPPPAAQALRERARAFSDDPTHQAIALESAREEASDPMLREALDTALDALERESGSAITAGRNISRVAADAERAGVGQTQTLRNMYREVVAECDDIAGAYARITKEHPSKSIEEAIDFMLRALGADLGATDHSAEPARLKHIVDDMYQLKALASVKAQCAALATRIDARTNAGNDTEAVLMQALVAAPDQAWRGAEAFEHIPGALGAQRTSDAVYALNGFKTLVRALPEKALGGDAAKRERVITAVQEALDGAIEAEEDGE